MSSSLSCCLNHTGTRCINTSVAPRWPWVQAPGPPLSGSGTSMLLCAEWMGTHLCPPRPQALAGLPWGQHLGHVCVSGAQHDDVSTDRDPGTGYGLGASAAVLQRLRLDTPLLQRQTQRNCETTHNWVHRHLKQILGKRYKQTKTNCQFWRAWSKSMPPAQDAS